MTIFHGKLYSASNAYICYGELINLLVISKFVSNKLLNCKTLIFLQGILIDVLSVTNAVLFRNKQM